MVVFIIIEYRSKHPICYPDNCFIVYLWNIEKIFNFAFLIIGLIKYLWNFEGIFHLECMAIVLLYIEGILREYSIWLVIVCYRIFQAVACVHRRLSAPWHVVFGHNLHCLRPFVCSLLFAFSLD